MRSILISTVVLLVYILGQAHAEVLVTVNVSLTSSIRYDRYVMCLSDYPDSPSTCTKRPYDKRLSHPRDYTNGTIWWFSRDELIEERNKGRDVVRAQTARIPWRSYRDPAGEQYLIITDWDDKERQIIDLSQMTLKTNANLKTTVMDGLSISVHIECANRYFGELCVVGCDQNPRWTCHPETGKLTCNDNWDGFHCNKEYCLHGGFYENRTICRCTGNWTGKRCNDTMPAETVKLDAGWWPNSTPSYSAEPHSIFASLCLVAAILLTIVCMITVIVFMLNIKKATARRRREEETPSIQTSQLLLSIDDDSYPVKPHQELLVRDV